MNIEALGIAFSTGRGLLSWPVFHSEVHLEGEDLMVILLFGTGATMTVPLLELDKKFACGYDSQNLQLARWTCFLGDSGTPSTKSNLAYILLSIQSASSCPFFSCC